MRFTSALVVVSVLLLAPAAWADSVCIGVDSIPLVTPGASAEVGTLEKRTCHGVLERLDAGLRVWVTNDTFQGEAIVPNDAVLHLLVDDVDLKAAGGEPYGRVLSGTPVVVVARGGDTVTVSTVEGRVALTFEVESDAVFPTEKWPRPDLDEEPPDGWPETDRVVPPAGGRITSDSAGLSPIAEVGPVQYDVQELLLDPAQGRMGYTIVEQTELDARVKLVTPTLWVEGYAPALEWREDPPAMGWNPTEGMTQRPPWVPAPRQIGTKPAPLSTEAKADPFGTLPAGARVTVSAEEKGWMQVSAAWPGGDVAGWVQKKFVLKEGKEAAASPTVHPVASVAVWQMARQWEDATGHEAENEDGVVEPTEPDVDLESVRRQITDRFGALRMEYARLLSRDAALAGTLTGRLVVDPEGTIVKAHLPEGSLRDPGLQETLVGILESVQFEEREIPKTKRRKKKDEPEMNWNAQIWIQFSFKASAG